MDNRAIGVFDSGLGGLTVVKELHKILPNENIVYLGDTGRVPYGSRSRETIIKYAMEDINLLKSKDVKMIIAACGTVSSTLPKEISDNLGVPYADVVIPSAQEACALTAAAQSGSQKPRALTPIPVVKSMYSFPSIEVQRLPLPETMQRSFLA